MATIATIPALALPGKPLQLVFTATAGGNFVKVWCTSAPRGSKLRQQLDKEQSARVNVIAESDIASRPSYTFDVGGIYVLEIEEFQKGSEAFGGRYRGDPAGFRTEERVAANIANISVSSLIACEIGVSPDTATLQLYVNDLSIVATTIAVHGVASPLIIKPATDKARAAADAPNVTAAVLALADVVASGTIGDFRAHIDQYIDKFNRHLLDTDETDAAHATADDNNAVGDGFKSPRNLKSIARTLAECAKRFGYHITNVDPTASSPDPGSADYHDPTGSSPASDWLNALLAAGGSTMGACQVLFADLYRCFELHRASDVHDFPDTVHVLTTLPALPALHAAYLTELASLTPAVPLNEHTAKVVLVSGAGFKES